MTTLPRSPVGSTATTVLGPKSSVSLNNTLMITDSSSVVVIWSFTATGGLLAPKTVTVTTAVDVPP